MESQANLFFSLLLQEIEKIALVPDVEHHRNALFFLAELLSEVPLQEYSDHLPKILHIVFLGM